MEQIYYMQVAAQIVLPPGVEVIINISEYLTGAARARCAGADKTNTAVFN